MDFEKNTSPSEQQPVSNGQPVSPDSGQPQPFAEAQPHTQPVENPAEPQTPYQTPVRASSDDQPIYHDEAHQQDAPQPPFEPGSQSYATYQQWQAQQSKHAKKPRSKKPLFILGGVAAAAALFFGGMALGGAGQPASAPSSSASSGQNQNLPVLSIAKTPSDDSEPSSSDGVMAGEDIYKKLNDSIVAIQTANSAGQSVSSGSGVVMSSDGYIITNAHVILDENTSQPMSNVAVLLANGTTLPAQVIGYDEQTDLAVVKVTSESALTPAEFGDSDALQVGETAYAIGSPGGVELANSMTNGIISAINRDITVNDRVMSLIQTSVTINPGNSGGALINKYGQVVGITSAKLGISYYEGLGFAIPINSAKEIVDELIQTGYISGRPSIGITGQNVSEQLSQFYSLPEGVQIVSVDSRAKAASEGLMAGDVITAVNGKTVTTMDEINEIKGDMKAGEKLKLTIYRPSTQKSMDLTITLTDAHDLEGTDPAQQQQQQQQVPENYDGNQGGYFDPFQFFFGY
jgi:serine protease Do